MLRGAAGLLGEGRIDFVLCECEFTPRPEEPHAAFADLHAILEPLGYRVVAFYSGGVNNHGWIWGDVLYRHASDHRARGLGYLAAPAPQHARDLVRARRRAVASWSR